MKGQELAPVEHIVQALEEKTHRLVELAPEIWKVMNSEDKEVSERRVGDGFAIFVRRKLWFFSLYSVM